MNSRISRQNIEITGAAMAVRLSLLIVEADAFVRMDAAAIAVAAGFQTFEAMDAFSALAFLAHGRPIDVIVVGRDAHGALNTAVLNHAMARRSQVEIIVIRGAADVDTLPPKTISIQNDYFDIALKVTLCMLVHNRAENRS